MYIVKNFLFLFLLILMFSCLVMPAGAQVLHQNKAANLQRKMEMRQMRMETRQAERRTERQANTRLGGVLASGVADAGVLQAKRMTMEERQTLRKQIRDARNDIYSQKRQ